MKMKHSPTTVSENSLFYISSTESLTLQKTNSPAFLPNFLPQISQRFIWHIRALFHVVKFKKKKITTKWAKLPNLGMDKGVKHHKLYLIFFSHHRYNQFHQAYVGHSRLVAPGSLWYPHPSNSACWTGSGWGLGENRLLKETNLYSNSQTYRNNDIGNSHQKFAAFEASFSFLSFSLSKSPVLHTKEV